MRFVNQTVMSFGPGTASKPQLAIDTAHAIPIQGAADWLEFSVIEQVGIAKRVRMRNGTIVVTDIGGIGPDEIVGRPLPLLRIRGTIDEYTLEADGELTVVVTAWRDAEDCRCD